MQMYRQEEWSAPYEFYLRQNGVDWSQARLTLCKRKNLFPRRPSNPIKSHQIPIPCRQARWLVTVITELSLHLIGRYPAQTNTNIFSFEQQGDCCTTEDDEMLKRGNEVQVLHNITNVP
jgi:hypothetical protein